jgi:hypothetical protein
MTLSEPHPHIRDAANRTKLGDVNDAKGSSERFDTMRRQQ